MSKPNKPFCEFCFSDDCAYCEKLKAYKQGRSDYENECAKRYCCYSGKDCIIGNLVEKEAYKQGREDAIAEFVDWYTKQDSYCKVSSGGRWKFTKFDEMTEVDIIAEFKKAKERTDETDR